MPSSARSIPRLDLGGLPPWRILRRRLALAAMLAVLLFAGYWFWLRDSSLVAVERVSVSGAGGDQELVTRVEAAALEQSTLDVDESALLASIESDPAVRGLSASTDFPHGLELELDLREPAGYIPEDGLVVAGDGVVLEQLDEAPAGLALLEAPKGTKISSATDRIDGEIASIASVVGAAPEPLRAQIDLAELDPVFGIVVEVGDGIELRFRSEQEAASKWAAASAVLADRELEATTYIDLTVPARPVAGTSDADGGVGADLDAEPPLDGAEVAPEGAELAPETVAPEGAEAVPEGSTEAAPEVLPEASTEG